MSGLISASVSAPLASVLRSGRGELNARFAAARVRYPDLDATAFGDFVRETVDPLVVAVERARPERVPDVVVAAYDIALELVGQKLVGHSARTSHVGEAWRRILPAVAPLVAVEPERIIASVCNAAHHLSATPGARPTAWIDTMSRLAEQCPDNPTFLTLGQVAAWRAGMAHFRDSALGAADKLPEPLVLAAVGASPVQWSEIRDRLRADPWFDPSTRESAPRVVARVGAFRGYGGLFTEPPTAAMLDGQLFVRGGAECWLLTADAFGATFNRATRDEFANARARSGLPEGISIRGSTLIVAGNNVALPNVFDRVSSACANGTTVAVTSPHTHAVLLIALAVR